MSFAITRIVNSCILLELNGDAVVTDPYFDDHWFMRFNEPIGLRAEQLPRLAAVLGGHRVFDHWRPGSMRAYAHKASTPCLVATEGMRRSANAAGFPLAAALKWGERREVSPTLRIEAVKAHWSFGAPVNSYLIEAGGLRVFVGTEARDLEPLHAFRRSNPAVDIALLPVDGATLLGHRLVMRAQDAIEGARILGARTFIPIHYSQKSIPPLLSLSSSLQSVTEHDTRGLEVAAPAVGVRWSPSL
jgi:L-ascorbate metabolism protein UlaG (beta-lactamase superfamily)